MRAILLLTVVILHSTVYARPSLISDDDDYRWSPHIMGGIGADDGQFPWTVSIEFDGSLGWLHWCGGVIINSLHAITGAKCVHNRNPADLRVYAGMLWRNDTAATDSQLVEVDNYVMHPAFDEFTAGTPNDLAVIRFKSPLNLTQYNIEAALLPPDDLNDYNHGGCFINGWGRYNNENKFSQQMLYYQLPVISNTDCDDRIYSISNAAIYDTHICVLSDPPGHGACNGDQGSPLNCEATENDGGPLYVVGVASWTIQVNENCDPYFPSVYTRLSKYLQWIADNTPDN